MPQTWSLDIPAIPKRRRSRLRSRPPMCPSLWAQPTALSLARGGSAMRPALSGPPVPPFPTCSSSGGPRRAAPSSSWPGAGWGRRRDASIALPAGSNRRTRARGSGAARGPRIEGKRPSGDAVQARPQQARYPMARGRTGNRKLLPGGGPPGQLRADGQAPQGRTCPLESWLPRLQRAGMNVSVIALGGDGLHHRDGDARPCRAPSTCWTCSSATWRPCAPRASGAGGADQGTTSVQRPDDGVVRFVLEIEGGAPSRRTTPPGSRMAREAGPAAHLLPPGGAQHPPHPQRAQRAGRRGNEADGGASPASAWPCWRRPTGWA